MIALNLIGQNEVTDAFCLHQTAPSPIEGRVLQYADVICYCAPKNGINVQSQIINN
jgi:hypothetical protein